MKKLTALTSLAFMALVLSLFVSSQSFAGSDEYHDCMSAGGYHEDCKHHLQ